jgi:cytochrome c oxidase subunit 2
MTDRGTARALGGGAPLTIKVTANQWWWDVEYQNQNASRSVRTANELHLPAGRLVDLTLASSDVIHSFWVPSLAGKQDLIPGRANAMRLQPRRIGRYRGQCAEFCGLQHSKMALDVIVESPAAWRAWYEKQLQPAAAPASPLAAQGQSWFMSHPCASCHAIAGTDASGRVGPDLTHLTGRSSLGAGALPMNRSGLYGWVANPQSAKPGNHMPVMPMEAGELHALVAYLETLQ